MVCTLRGVCVTCQTSACKRLSQFYSSEAGWVLVDSYTLEQAVEWIYKLKEEQLRISVKTEDPVLRCVVKVSTCLHCWADLYQFLLCCF